MCATMRKASGELFIFDLGNVLVRNITVLPAIAGELGLPLDTLEEDYRLYENAMMAGLFPIEAYYRHLADRFGVTVSGDIFKRHFHPLVNGPVLSMVDSLRARRGRCVIGSNTFRSHWDFIYETGLADHFDAAYASHLIHAVKPCKAFFATVLALENADRRHAHHFDDSRDNVVGAASLGLDAFLYSGNDDELEAFLGSFS